MNIEYDSIKKIDKTKDLVLFITTKKNPLDSIIKKIKENTKKKEYKNTSNLILTLYPNFSDIESKYRNLDITIVHIPTFQVRDGNAYTRHIAMLEKYKKILENKYSLKYFEPIKIENVKGIWVPLSFLFNVRNFLLKSLSLFHIRECIITTHNVRSGLYVTRGIERLIRRNFKVRKINKNLILNYSFFIKDHFYQSMQLFLKIFFLIKNSLDLIEINKEYDNQIKFFPIQIESNLDQRLFTRLDTLSCSNYRNYQPFIFSFSTASRFLNYKNKLIKVCNVLEFNFPLFVNSMQNLILMFLVDLLSGRLIISSMYYNFLFLYINEKSIKSNYFKFFHNKQYLPLYLSIWGDGFLAEGDIITRKNPFKNYNFKLISLTSRTFIWIEYVSKLYINSLSCLTSSPISEDIINNNFLSNIKIEKLFSDNSLSKSKRSGKIINSEKVVFIDLPNYQLHPSWVSFIELMNFKILIDELEKIDNIKVIAKPHPSFKTIKNFFKSFQYLKYKKSVFVKDPNQNIDKLISNYLDFHVFFITRNSTLSTKFYSQGVKTFVLSNDYLNIQSEAFNKKINISNNVANIIKSISSK